MERTSAKILQGDKYRIEIADESRIVTSPGIVLITTAKIPVAKSEQLSSVPELPRLRVVA